MSKSLTAAVREKVRDAFALLDDETVGIYGVYTQGHEERVFVVGKYRVALFKTGKLGKAVLVRHFPFYELRKIAVPDVTRVILTFKTSKDTITCAYLQKHVEAELIEGLCSAYAALTINWPDKERAQFSQKGGKRDVFKPSKSYSYGGFRESYVGFCNLKKIPFSRKLLRSIKAQEGRVLDISDAPDLVEDPTRIAPVFDALRFNCFFRTVTLVGMPAVHSALIMSGLAEALERNRAIEEIIVSDCGIAATDVGVVCKSIISNRQINVKGIDFSSNKLGDKGISDFASAISSSTLRLESLNFSDNGATGKGIATLAVALGGDPSICKTLKHFDVSGNKLGPVGAQALGKWLHKLYDQNESKRQSLKKKQESGFEVDKSDVVSSSWALVSLNLGNTQMDVGGILGVLRMNDDAFANLKRLDVSHAKLSLDDGRKLAKFCAEQPVLSELNISYCGASCRSVMVIMYGMLKNHALKDVSLQAAGNDIGSDEVTLLEPILRDAAKTELTSLSMSSNDFGNEGVVRVVNALRDNTKLQSLALGMNFKSNAKGETQSLDSIGAEVGDALATLGNLKTLSLRGNEQSNLGVGCAALLHRIGSLPKLENLDVSGNRMGDEATAELCGLFLSLRSLRSINVDGNEFSVASYQSFKSALKDNLTLVHFEPPLVDLRALASHSKKLYLSLEKVLEVIYHITEKNSTRTQDEVEAELTARKLGKKPIQTVEKKEEKVEKKEVKAEKAAIVAPVKATVTAAQPAVDPAVTAAMVRGVSVAMQAALPKPVAGPAPTGRDVKAAAAANEVARLEAELERIRAAKAAKKAARVKAKEEERLKRLEELEQREKDLELMEREEELKRREEMLRSKQQQPMDPVILPVQLAAPVPVVRERVVHRRPVVENVRDEEITLVRSSKQPTRLGVGGARVRSFRTEDFSQRPKGFATSTKAYLQRSRTRSKGAQELGFAFGREDFVDINDGFGPEEVEFRDDDEDDFGLDDAIPEEDYYVSDSNDSTDSFLGELPPQVPKDQQLLEDEDSFLNEPQPDRPDDDDDEFNPDNEEFDDLPPMPEGSDLGDDDAFDMDDYGNGDEPPEGLSAEEQMIWIMKKTGAL